MFRLITLSFVTIILFSCNNQPDYFKNQSHANVPDESITKGQALAVQYCQSCHALPDPSLLSSQIWQKGVLPAMGPRLGIFEYQFQRYINSLGDPNVSNYYPSQPVISLEQWQNIIDYYTSLSPDALPLQSRKQKIDTNLALFTAAIPAIKYQDPATCFIAADTFKHSIYVSDIIKQSIYSYNSKLHLQDSIKTGGCIVQLIQPQNTGITLCNIGVFTPNNAKAGSIQNLTFKNEKFQLQKKAVYNQLLRPVHISEADIDIDGRKDYVVCEFGYLIGAFSWLQNKGDSTYVRHVIRNVPGAIKSVITDFNKDGKPDIVALFAQGDEGIFLFINKGNGIFDTKEVLRFPPSNGSSYFELDDFNHDGYPDILYTCGDNADYSQILKPYHGVYIYLNDKHNNFKQTFFFPVNGCYKAMARDFDNDGDLDIATIAYFANFAHQPDEGFIYLENKGNLTFQPYSLPATRQGRWINMDVADIDGDHRPDILLANCSVGPTINYAAYNWKKGPPFMVLKNTGQENERE